MTLAEYRTSIELATQRVRAAERERALAVIQETLKVLDYTSATAAHHARLLAYVKRSGRKRGVLDLIIAAHAAETGRTLVSRDALARFGDLPGVRAEQP